MTNTSYYLGASITVGALDTASWEVVEFDCVESLSSSYRYSVRLRVSEAPAVASLLGKTASLKLEVRDYDARTPRYFHGVVLEARTERAREEVEGRTAELRLVVGARLERARFGRDCRIFQGKSVKDVVTDVLTKPSRALPAVLPAASIQWFPQLSSAAGGAQPPPPVTYESQPYIAQFNESDYDFVCRLLFEEGIVFAVRNTETEEQVVFFDEAASLVPLADTDTLSFRTGSPSERILELRDRISAVSDTVMLRDYDFHHAGIDLSANAEAESAGAREVYLHPGNFDLVSPRGDRLAQRTLQRLSARKRQLSGRSDNPHLEPGRKLTIEQHRRLGANCELQLLSVTHRLRWGDAEGGEDAYENEFVAIPADVPYRPEQSPPAPAHGGVEVAFCTGADGAELHGSDFGQVKVRFPWDRSGILTDQSSTWLRVGQFAMPGPMIVPRVGFEVLVDYELGDYDRPLVVGHLYNGEAMPPYELPGGATTSSFQTATTDGGAGANELRFGDAAGSEEMFLNASHDYVTSIENDLKTNVGVNEKTSTGANLSLKVGANLNNTVTGNRTLTIGASQDINCTADATVASTGAMSTTVGMRLQTVGGDLTEDVGSTLKRTVGALQSVTAITGYNRKIKTNSHVKVVGAWIEMTNASRATTCKGRIETVGALKMIKAKTMSVNAGAAYVMNAASETVTCGGNRVDKADIAVGVKAKGLLKAKGANINITGESKVTLKVKGSSIVITSDSITVKTKTLDLSDAKTFKSSSSHKGNS